MTTNLKPIRPNKQYGDTKAVAEMSRGLKPVAGTDALSPAKGEGRPRVAQPAQQAQNTQPPIPPEHEQLLYDEAEKRRAASIWTQIAESPGSSRLSKMYAQMAVAQHQQAAQRLKMETPDYGD